MPLAKAPSTKFNIARKRKFVAKGVGRSKAHSYFLYGPGDINFQFNNLD